MALPAQTPATPEQNTAVLREAPSNIEAEQALLGAILVNNLALNHVSDRLRPEHFYEPIHHRIYEAIQHLHDKGQIANPVTLKHYFDRDAALADIGGAEYLARLAAAARELGAQQGEIDEAIAAHLRGDQANAPNEAKQPVNRLRALKEEY